MDESKIELFNPTVAELQRLVETSKALVITDANDKKQLEVVKEMRITLRDARVSITKKGKELRENAIKFQRDVLAKEKELIAIIEPEEDRLQKIEDEVKEHKLKEERIALLPERKDRLSKIGDNIEVADEVLLGMDSTQFTEYVNGRQTIKNEFDRKVLEAREHAAKEEELRLQREKDAREREEKAREEERQKADQRIKDEQARVEREAKEKTEREAKKKADDEAAEKTEKLRLEKEKRFQAWLKENDYTKANATNFVLKDLGTSVVLYKVIGTYIK